MCTTVMWFWCMTHTYPSSVCTMDAVRVVLLALHVCTVQLNGVCAHALGTHDVFVCRGITQPRVWTASAISECTGSMRDCHSNTQY